MAVAVGASWSGGPGPGRAGGGVPEGGGAGVAGAVACGGEACAQLAVTLQWRLPATAAALSQEAAWAVEAKILPAAGDMTYAPRCGGR